MSQPRELPILFTPDNLRSVRDGRKTQTRRIVKPQPTGELLGTLERPGSRGGERWWFSGGPTSQTSLEIKPRYRVGDLLWCKEAWSPSPDGYLYRLGQEAHGITECDDYVRWKSPLFMPKAAARTWLEVTNVRCQRLQEISEADARAEGCDYPCSKMKSDHFACCSEYPHLWPYRDALAALWNSIHGDGAWERNDHVFAYTFRRIER